MAKGVFMSAKEKSAKDSAERLLYAKKWLGKVGWILAKELIVLAVIVESMLFLLDPLRRYSLSLSGFSSQLKKEIIIKPAAN